MPRFYCPVALNSGASLCLPAGAARHVQVLRLQPGDTITLFNGGPDVPDSPGGEFTATITRMGRSDVEVSVGTHTAVNREADVQIHLALGMPANDRMDWLVEKATELGVASIQPLATERSVLKLQGERAAKKQAHWQSIAIAACEQSGRNQVPLIHAVQPLGSWAAACATPGRFLMSLQSDAQPLLKGVSSVMGQPLVFLSGPEGGLTPEEEAAARACGFTPLSLGARTLRAETAPLAVLAALTLRA
jgi:16S rRNA (uracil1498-N3)-methyltransferase